MEHLEFTFEYSDNIAFVDIVLSSLHLSSSLDNINKLAYNLSRFIDDYFAELSDISVKINFCSDKEAYSNKCLQLSRSYFYDKHGYAFSTTVVDKESGKHLGVLPFSISMPLASTIGYYLLNPKNTKR